MQHSAFKASLTDWIVRIVWVVINLDDKHDHCDVYDTRVEVGHVKRGTQSADERIRSYDGRHQHGGQFNAQSFHKICHDGGASCWIIVFVSRVSLSTRLEQKS